MNNPITRAEHEEFKKRLESWNNRQDKRIELLENSVKNLEKLSISIEKLATNMENMLKEQIDQGKRIEVLENRDGEMWRKFTVYIVTAIIGIVLGFIFNQIGM